MYHSGATGALKQSHVFQNKARIMGKCANGGSCQVPSCKTLQNIVPFVLYVYYVLEFRS